MIRYSPGSPGAKTWPGSQHCATSRRNQSIKFPLVSVKMNLFWDSGEYHVQPQVKKLICWMLQANISRCYISLNHQQKAFSVFHLWKGSSTRVQHWPNKRENFPREDCRPFSVGQRTLFSNEFQLLESFFSHYFRVQSKVQHLWHVRDLSQTPVLHDKQTSHVVWVLIRNNVGTHLFGSVVLLSHGCWVQPIGDPAPYVSLFFFRKKRSESWLMFSCINNTCFDWRLRNMKKETKFNWQEKKLRTVMSGLREINRDMSSACILDRKENMCCIAAAYFVCVVTVWLVWQSKPLCHWTMWLIERLT